MSEWISVEVDTPKNDASVFVFDIDKNIASIGLLKRDEDGKPLPLPWYTMHDSIYHNYNVTHWMKIERPEPLQ